MRRVINGPVGHHEIELHVNHDGTIELWRWFECVRLEPTEIAWLREALNELAAPVQEQRGEQDQ